jgi:hypothetical protein
MGFEYVGMWVVHNIVTIQMEGGISYHIWNMYGSPNQSMDDKFFVQGIFVIFQKVSYRLNLSKQPSSINYRWAWFTC